MNNPELLNILLLIPGGLLGLAFHEAAHAFVAYRLGDSTAKDRGRLTLNPLKHLDLIGTLMIFIVHFGWAKPVPVNPSNFANPKRDNLLVSLAGPLSNFILAALFGLAVRALAMPAALSSGMVLLKQVLLYGVMINVALAIFNLLPVPPLDGSRLVHILFPRRFERHYQTFQKVGGFLLLGVIVLSMATDIHVISTVIGPPITFFMRFFAGI